MNPLSDAKRPCAEAYLHDALADSRSDLTGCVKRIRTDVARLADPKVMAQYHPWLLIGSGMAVGLLGASGLAHATAPRAPTAPAAVPPTDHAPARVSLVDRIAPLIKLVLPLLM